MGLGFVNNPVNISKLTMFPEVTLLLSGGEVAIIKIPVEVFSIVNEEIHTVQ